MQKESMENKENTKIESEKNGGTRVGTLGTVSITAYLIIVSIFLLYSLVVFWPSPIPTEVQERAGETGKVESGKPETPSAEHPEELPSMSAEEPSEPPPGMQSGQAETPPAESFAKSPQLVTFLGMNMAVKDEHRLLLIVAVAGALGSLIHALRSLTKYVGVQKLEHNWLPMYILLPFVGSTLAVLFYLVIRGGFFSTGATVQATSPFGFAALAGLVGLFTEQAVLKLKEVATTLLAKAEKGKGHFEDDEGKGKQQEEGKQDKEEGESA